ncbi:MAG: hypothetical protein CMD18_01465 [Flavobacteriales bacterium]|nr:hypothetical protein [Flavobacteriales bacterium]
MKKFLHITLLFLLIVSCRKNNEENIEGPSLNDLYGPFDILSNLELNDSINFSTGENVAFKMEISKKTDWEIEVTGSSTGAKKKFTGKSRILSLENASWKGGADAFPSFALEKSYITIRFPNEENAPIINDTITITGLKKEKGTLITSFEDDFKYHWDSFNQETVNGAIICSDGNAAKGDCYYKWNGLVNWTKTDGSYEWIIGKININAPDSGFSLPTNAKTLFFNMGNRMVSNTGNNNCLIRFSFDEDDNGDGIFDPGKEDRFTYEYWYENDQWNLISFKYGDLKYDSDGNLANLKGNGLPEPSKLISIEVLFLANSATGKVSEADADHIIFTENEPYKP